MAIHSSPRSASSRSTSRPRAGRSATGSSCRSRRTRRSSRCSARPTAATASPTSRCRTCRATRRCTRARGRACRCTTSARPAASETVTLLESRDPVAHPHVHGLEPADANPASRPPTTSLGRTVGATPFDAGSTPRRRSCNDELQRHRARRRRPAAQQHAAVPDAQLLHRAAGRLPAADLI